MIKIINNNYNNNINSMYLKRYTTINYISDY